jgi:hypothetical protein
MFYLLEKLCFASLKQYIYQLAPRNFVRNKKWLSAPLGKGIVPQDGRPGMGLLRKVKKKMF